MNTTSFSLPANTAKNRRMAMRVLLTLPALTLLLGSPMEVRGQMDDFSDGNDTANPSWTHNFGYVGSTGQSWTVADGAYRLQAPNNGLQGYGYVGSFVGLSYSDVRVSADFLSFSAPLGGAFGIGARLNSDNSLANLNGYGYAYEPFAANGLGEMVLYRINNGVDLDDLNSVQVTLDPGKDYRFILDISGTTLRGSVLELGGGLVADQTVVDSTYASGVSGVFGYSSSAVGLPASDFTVDNFVVTVPEPGAGLLFGAGAAVVFAACRRRSK